MSAMMSVSPDIRNLFSVVSAANTITSNCVELKNVVNTQHCDSFFLEVVPTVADEDFHWCVSAGWDVFVATLARAWNLPSGEGSYISFYSIFQPHNERMPPFIVGSVDGNSKSRIHLGLITGQRRCPICVYPCATAAK